MIALTIGLLFGGFIAIIFWQLYLIFHVVPQQDRAFMDRPPFGFRLIWPLIEVLVFYGRHLLGSSQCELTSMRLKSGGVEFSLTAEQFIAAKVVASIIFTLVCFAMLSMLGKSAFVLSLIGGLAGFFYPELWLKETTDRRRGEIIRTLPFYLDIITLSVEAGSNLTGGLTQAVQKSGDSPLRSELNRVLRDIRAGKTRADALRDMSDRAGSIAVSNLVSSLIQAERTGSSLGPLLRAQAEQLRSERFQRAEKQAMEAPVKLLGPLVMFIFPTTFMVLGFLVLSKAMQEQLLTWAPLVWAYNWPG